MCIPTHKGWGGTYHHQRHTSGETHNTVPPPNGPSHLNIHHRLANRTHLHRATERELGWVQIHQKSLRWEENIQVSPRVGPPSRPYDGKRTYRSGWDSCITQRQLEITHTFTPMRNILQTIQRICQVEGIHGLPSIVALTFLPMSSRNKDTWWQESTGESTNAKSPQDE